MHCYYASAIILATYIHEKKLNERFSVFWTASVLSHAIRASVLVISIQGVYERIAYFCFM
jgi:hypothetical protein